VRDALAAAGLWGSRELHDWLARRPDP
jgi:hypothetical protein